MGIGEGAIAVSIAAVAITVLKTKPWERNGISNGNNPCPLHSGIEASLTFLKDGIDRIEEKLDKIIGG